MQKSCESAKGNCEAESEGTRIKYRTSKAQAD